jgi:thiosulfate/3-mercaptopyruvate sulfurtransferase
MGEDMIRKKVNGQAIFLAFLIALFVLTSNSMAECASCKAAANEDWSKSAQSFLSGVALEQAVSSQTTAQQSKTSLANSNDDLAQNAPQRSGSMQKILVPVSDDISSYDVILDVSPQASEYIPGAVSIPYDSFIGKDGSMKPVAEVAKILGDAGISEKDSLLLYGKCLPCGTNALTSPYVYWILKYLGHDKVKVLDGSIDNWVAAKLPTNTAPKVLPKVNYTPNLRPELLANYDFVKNGHIQIVDARTFQDYGMGYIPGALNIPYSEVLINGRIKSEAELRDLFAIKNLNKTEPVVVYTNMGTQASIVWFALQLMGYDSRLYSWNDWLDHQPHLDIQLKDIHADPNPATQGTPIKITAIFDQAEKGAIEKTASTIGVNQTVLTVKGCATCGFGSPQGFANINKSSGIAQLGSYGASKSQGEAFTCTAYIKNSSGKEVAKVNMKRVSGDQYVGIWNANVEPGIYKTTIAASANGADKTFPNVLDITIALKG